MNGSKRNVVASVTRLTIGVSSKRPKVFYSANVFSDIIRLLRIRTVVQTAMQGLAYAAHSE